MAFKWISSIVRYVKQAIEERLEMLGWFAAAVAVSILITFISGKIWLFYRLADHFAAS